MSTVQFVLQSIGDYFAIGMTCDIPKEIIYQYYSFLNLGYTTGNLQWLNNNFAFLYLEKEKFQDWMYKSSIKIFENTINDDFDKQNKDHINKVNRIMGKRLLAIKNDTFVYPSNKPRDTGYRCFAPQEVMS